MDKKLEIVKAEKKEIKKSNNEIKKSNAYSSKEISKMKYLKECIELFFVFFKTGFIAFGGGLAILKIYEEEFVNKRKWLTKEELFDYYILSQVTPGIIILSTSSYIGYKLKKQTGIFLSVLGVIIPSITVIVIIAMCLENFNEYVIVQKILRGMNVGVAAVLIDVMIEFIRKNIKNVIYAILFVSSFVAMQFFNISVLYIVAIAGIVGLLVNDKNINDKIKETGMQDKIDESEDGLC